MAANIQRNLNFVNFRSFEFFKKIGFWLCIYPLGTLGISIKMENVKWLSQIEMGL